MIENHHSAARTADAPHFANNGYRIGHDTDDVWSVDDVERIVGKFQIGGVHREETDVREALAQHAFARLFEHRLRQVDAGDDTVGRIETRVDSGAYANLEYAVARLDTHALDRLNSARVQRRTECEVVHPGDVFVNLGDESILDGSDRQCTRGRVVSQKLFRFGSAWFKYRHVSPQRYSIDSRV